MDRPKRRDPEPLRDLDPGEGRDRRGIDEHRLEPAALGPGDELLDPAAVGTDAVGDAHARHVGRDAELVELVAERPVHGADHGRVDEAARGQLAEQVLEVELGAAEGQLVGEEDGPDGAGPVLRRPGRRLGVLGFVDLAGGGDRDPARQLVPLAAGAVGDAADVDVAVLAGPRGQVLFQFEAGEARRGAEPAREIDPGDAQPRQPEEVVAEMDLDPGAGAGRERRPAPDPGDPAGNDLARRGLVDPAVGDRLGRQQRHPVRRIGPPDPPRRPQAPANPAERVVEGAQAACPVLLASQPWVRAIPA